MEIQRTPEIVHTVQLVVLGQRLGGTVPMVDVIDLIVQMILTALCHIGLGENTVIPGAACRIGIYSRRKCHSCDIAEIAASAVPLFQRLLHSDLHHIRGILVCVVISVCAVCNICILRRIPHCLWCKILRIFVSRFLNDLCGNICPVDLGECICFRVAGVGVRQYLRCIQRPICIHHRFHAIGIGIQECHTVQIPVAVVVRLKLYLDIFIIFQRSRTRAVCHLMYTIVIGIHSMTVGICSIIRIIRVSQNIIGAVAVCLFVLNIACHKFRAGSKPCLLQVQTCLAPYNRRILCGLQIFPVCIVFVSLAHCQPEPVSVLAVGHILHCLRQLLQLVGCVNFGACIVLHRLHILCSLGVLIQQCVILTANGSVCGARTRNVGNGLIQKFPHIHLGILVRTETNIVHQIVHIHLDIAVLYLLEIVPGISFTSKAIRQHRIEFAICSIPGIIVVNMLLIILTNAGEICRMQSAAVHSGCGSIICIGGRSVHHGQVFFLNGRRVAELDLLTRLQNEVRIRSIFITQAQFIHGKGNLICGILVRVQIVKCLLCCIG